LPFWKSLVICGERYNIKVKFSADAFGHDI
jgi:hypothetical protein